MRDFGVFGDMVPAVGAVVDGVEDEALVFGVGGEVGFGEEGLGDEQGGGAIAGGEF